MASVAQTVKCLSTVRQTRVQSLVWEDPLEKEISVDIHPLCKCIELVGYKNSSQGPAFIMTKILCFHDILLIILESCPFSCICLKVKVAQPFLTLCDPMDYTVHGILQSRILEWVAFPFSWGSSQRDQTQVSHIADGFFTS